MKHFSCILVVLAALLVCEAQADVVKRSLAKWLDVGRVIVGAILGQRGESALGLPYTPDNEDGSPGTSRGEDEQIIINIPAPHPQPPMTPGAPYGMHGPMHGPMPSGSPETMAVHPSGWGGPPYQVVGSAGYGGAYGLASSFHNSSSAHHSTSSHTTSSQMQTTHGAVYGVGLGGVGGNYNAGVAGVGGATAVGGAGGSAVAGGAGAMAIGAGGSGHLQATQGGFYGSGLAGTGGNVQGVSSPSGRPPIQGPLYISTGGSGSGMSPVNGGLADGNKAFGIPSGFGTSGAGNSGITSVGGGNNGITPGQVVGNEGFRPQSSFGISGISGPGVSPYGRSSASGLSVQPGGTSEQLGIPYASGTGVSFGTGDPHGGGYGVGMTLQVTGTVGTGGESAVNGENINGSGKDGWRNPTGRPTIPGVCCGSKKTANVGGSGQSVSGSSFEEVRNTLSANEKAGAANGKYDSVGSSGIVSDSDGRGMDETELSGIRNTGSLDLNLNGRRTGLNGGVAGIDISGSGNDRSVVRGSSSFGQTGRDPNRNQKIPSFAVGGRGMGAPSSESGSEPLETITKGVVSGGSGSSRLIDITKGSNAGSGLGPGGFASGSSGSEGFASGSSGSEGFASRNAGYEGFASGNSGSRGSGSKSIVSGSFGSGGFASGSSGSADFASGSTGSSGFASGSTGSSGFASGNTVSGGPGSSQIRVITQQAELVGKSGSRSGSGSLDRFEVGEGGFSGGMKMSGASYNSTSKTSSSGMSGGKITVISSIHTHNDEEDVRRLGHGIVSHVHDVVLSKVKDGISSLYSKSEQQQNTDAFNAVKQAGSGPKVVSSGSSGSYKVGDVYLVEEDN